MEKSN